MPKSSQSNPKHIVARKVWATFCASYVLPADSAAYDQMIEQMAEGAFKRVPPGKGWAELPDDWKEGFREPQRANLAAIGITRPTQ